MRSGDAGHGCGSRVRLVRALGDGRAATSRQAATSASAKASSLMCSGRRSSLRSAPARKPLLDRRRTARGRPRDRGTAGPGRSIAETPPSGIRKRTGPRHRVELAGDERADRAAFVGAWCASASRSGCGGTGAAPRKRSGTRVPGAEVDHVERAAGADVGQRHGARTRRAASARPTARRRRSRRRSRWSRRRSRRRAGPSRRASPSTGRRRRWRGRRGSRSSSSSRLVTACTQGVVTPNIVRPSAGLVGARCRRRVRDHAGQRVRGVGQHLLADAVDALHVGDRIHHADVARADVGPRVAAGHGRDHHLGHADRQRAHRLRRQRGAARAAGRDDAAEVAPRAR